MHTKLKLLLHHCTDTVSFWSSFSKSGRVHFYKRRRFPTWIKSIVSFQAIRQKSIDKQNNTQNVTWLVSQSVTHNLTFFTYCNCNSSLNNCVILENWNASRAATCNIFGTKTSQMKTIHLCNEMQLN